MNKHKPILITGASTGIGYYCAHQLHQSGYQVIASCRHPKDVERLNAEGLVCIHLDLADSNSIQTAVQQCLQLTQGRLYALFNNGAYGQPGAVEDLPRASPGVRRCRGRSAAEGGRLAVVRCL